MVHLNGALSNVVCAILPHLQTGDYHSESSIKRGQGSELPLWSQLIPITILKILISHSSKLVWKENPKGGLKNPFPDLQPVINDKNKTLAKKLTFLTAAIMRYMNWKLLLKNQTDQLIMALQLQVKVSR